jgi:hypothetical protein
MKKPKAGARTVTMKDLSPRARSAFKTKRIVGRGEFRSWRKLLKELAQFDEDTGRLITRAKGMAALSGVLAVVSGIVAGVIGDKLRGSLDDRLAPVLAGGLLLLTALCVVAMIYHLARLILLSRVDLADSFRLLLVPVLNELEEDLDPKAKVRLYLDLRGPVKGKIVRTRKLPAPRWTTIIESVYRDRWLRLVLELADGNVIRLEAFDVYTLLDRRRWQRGRRGKIKRKRKLKWRKAAVARVSLCVNNPDQIWDRDHLGRVNASAPLKLRNRNGKKFCGVVRKEKFKSVGKPPAETIAVSEIVGAMMLLYSLTRPAQEAASAPSTDSSDPSASPSPIRKQAGS